MSNPQQIVIVNPAAEVETVEKSMAPRLASLDGIRLGLVDNSKHMAAEALKAVPIALAASVKLAATATETVSARALAESPKTSTGPSSSPSATACFKRIPIP